MWSFFFFVACGSVSEPSKDSPQKSIEDTAVTDSGASLITLDEYVEIYCESLGVGCGIYTTMEECRIDLNTGWFNGCEVVDHDALELCADWISSLACDEEGWISECSDRFECQ